MLSHSYYHKKKFDEIKAEYPDAVFYAVSLWRYQYISTMEWNQMFIWEKALSPSPKLLQAYKDDKIDFDDYVPIFRTEMDNTASKAVMLKIAKEAMVKPVFLFCHCGPKEGTHCHRFILLDMIEEIARENGIPVEIMRDNYLL